MYNTNYRDFKFGSELDEQFRAAVAFDLTSTDTAEFIWKERKRIRGNISAKALKDLQRAFCRSRASIAHFLLSHSSVIRSKRSSSHSPSCHCRGTASKKEGVSIHPTASPPSRRRSESTPNREPRLLQPADPSPPQPGAETPPGRRSLCSALEERRSEMNTDKENSCGISKPADVPGMGNRVALSDLRNLVGVGHNEINKRVLLKKRILDDKIPTNVHPRPVTRKFVAISENNSEAYQQVTHGECERIKEENQHKPQVSSLSTATPFDSIDVAPVERMEEKVDSHFGVEVVEDLVDERISDIEEQHNSDLVVEMVEDLVNEKIPDIDSQDSNNPLAVVDYVEDIYAFYRQIEIESCVSPIYMSLQSDITAKMRAILIDWLIEVHYKFELMEETLFLTVNIIDRFLEKQTIERKKLQLVGVTALLLASKYEEVSVPEVQDLVYITNRAYTREEVLAMEMLIIRTLQFDLSVPTPYVFMRRFLKAAESDKKLEMLSFFILELCLVEYQMLRFRPSLLAAAAIFTAQCSLTGHKNWTRTCEVYTAYSEDQLLECSRSMVDFHQKAGLGKLIAVVKKFSESRYGYTAKSPPALFLLGSQ